MGTFNAVAFSLLGTVMGFIPALLPAHFSSAGMGGYNTSELWLEFMGFVQGSLGTFFLVRNEMLPLVLRATSWRIPAPGLAEQPQSGVILRPMAAAYLGGQDARERSVAA